MTDTTPADELFASMTRDLERFRDIRYPDCGTDWFISRVAWHIDRAASQPAQEPVWTQEQIDEIHRRGDAMFEKLNPSPPDIAKVVADNLSSLYDGVSQPAQEGSYMSMGGGLDLRQPAQEPVAWAIYWKDGQGLVSNGLSYVKHQEPITLHMDQVKVPLYAAPPSDQARQDRIDAERYRELLYSVGNKYPDESRHDTALRYIRNAEASCGGPAQVEREVRKP